jgi:hypothetical protein
LLERMGFGYGRITGFWIGIGVLGRVLGMSWIGRLD